MVVVERQPDLPQSVPGLRSPRVFPGLMDGWDDQTQQYHRQDATDHQPGREGFMMATPVAGGELPAGRPAGLILTDSTGGWLPPVAPPYQALQHLRGP